MLADGASDILDSQVHKPRHFSPPATSRLLLLKRIAQGILCPMNKPRVEYLVYRIIGRADYKKVARLDGELDGFRIVADGEKAWLYPIADLANQNDALTAAEPVVRNWESMAALQNGPGAFHLLFTGSKFEDPPPAPGLRDLTADGVVTGAPVLDSPTLTEVHSRLPDLPAGMSFDGKAGTMLKYFNLATTGRVRWADAGYRICTELHDLSALGHPWQGRNYRSAKKALKDDESTLGLGKLHKLVGSGGDRKADLGPPLTPEQEQIVMNTCRDIILRMARLEGGSDPLGTT